MGAGLAAAAAGVGYGLIGRHLTPPSAPSAPPALPAPPPQAAASEVAIATETEILGYRGDTTALFRFALNPRILVLVFPSMHAQAGMLLRVAALVEVRDLPRDRVLSQAALDAAIRARGAEPDRFYYGHDYRAGDIARFLDAAARTGQPLAPEEDALRRLADQQGWLTPAAANAGALLSIPMQGVAGDPGARAAILRHELSHGEFFTNPDYAAFCRLFWQTALTEGERARFRSFLAAQEYDPTDEDLMVNEAQAYLEHTRDTAFFRADAVGMTEERLAVLREKFLAGMPPGWLRDATRP